VVEGYGKLVKRILRDHGFEKLRSGIKQAGIKARL